MDMGIGLLKARRQPADRVVLRIFLVRERIHGEAMLPMLVVV